jgi:hypothetical protein
MNVVIWILAACCLPIAAAGIASLVDRRAGWSRVPFESEEPEGTPQYVIERPPGS